MTDPGIGRRQFLFPGAVHWRLQFSVIKKRSAKRPELFRSIEPFCPIVSFFTLAILTAFVIFLSMLVTSLGRPAVLSKLHIQ